MAFVGEQCWSAHCKPTLTHFTRCAAGDDTIPAFDKARILWAYAHLGVLHPPMMGRLLGGLKGQELVRMGPTGVAAAVWACAKLGYDRG